MQRVSAAASSFIDWLGRLSLAELFSSHRIEVRLLREQLDYERKEREREREEHEELREKLEVERQRLNDRVLLRNGVPPVFAVPTERPTTPVQRKTTLQKADEATRQRVNAERERYQAWLASAAAYKAQQEENGNGAAEQQEFPQPEE